MSPLESIEYSVRESKRAKHVNLRLTRTGNLEVVIPVGFDRAEIPSIISKHERWLNRASARLAKRQPTDPHLAKEGLPNRIELRAIAQEWLIEYTPAPVTRIRMSELDDTVLILWGNTPNEDLCQTALTQWLTRKADQHFTPWIRRLSDDIGLPFNRATFRGQKTRWGSCSSQKNISLNYKLLFLPAPLVNYVFIHELAHTIHMNHSDQFWHLVEQKEPDYRRLDKDLNDAMQYIPRWLEVWLASR
ncbi:M48 family metallopeptidase [filamentous cyanobacterium LEGE 11480]|uniref:M48 family metallopeptidase n=1 Tax=Romeriopsis navalis LEGE 11480 TaxID=2777977 RepID=A0A928VVK9_9CYAN|nr:SprT family zinc-dependent metalloprotease [Romeriopsis navalis]MBE9032859.1 M48 family metallopeptidase [Romeriopsis navalis LEGE 11480]